GVQTDRQQRIIDDEKRTTHDLGPKILGHEQHILGPRCALGVEAERLGTLHPALDDSLDAIVEPTARNVALIVDWDDEDLACLVDRTAGSEAISDGVDPQRLPETPIAIRDETLLTIETPAFIVADLACPFLDLDAVLGGELARSLHEVDRLELHEQRESISSFPAAEALIQPLVRAHVERRGLLLMKRTESPELTTHSLEGRVAPGDLEYVDTLLYLFDPVPHHATSSTLARAARKRSSTLSASIGN